jgi:hypothetical protein
MSLTFMEVNQASFSCTELWVTADLQCGQEDVLDTSWGHPHVSSCSTALGVTLMTAGQEDVPDLQGGQSSVL